MVYNDEPVPAMDVLLIYINKAYAALIDNKIANLSFKDANTPARSTITQKQPSGFKPGIKLYKYQLDAITWMKSIEDNQHIGILS